MYLLITNKSLINKAEIETERLLLQKFCGRRQSKSTQKLPERKKIPLIHNQVSSYAAVLSQNISQTPIQAMIYSPPSYKTPVSISLPLIQQTSIEPDPLPNHRTVTCKPKLLP